MMPSIVTDDLERLFHETNAHLRLWLDHIVNPPAIPPRTASPQQIAALLSELMRAGLRLRGLPTVKSPGLLKELDEYRANVERLRDLLPSIQSALLEERARLEQERSRLQSCAEWAQGSRQAL
jgi:hypothetical protein